MFKIDEEKFAQAALLANKENLTLEQQLNFYLEALKLAKEHNSNLPNGKGSISRRQNRNTSF
ncbi:hypothetical protein JZO72_08265 [Vagococcus fluvialis]|uniref:hypothetical protein n=1 Tax=Vagococcus fluvialis TaxID=2738 RepID=UPI001A8C85E8|nr:hypothetical protein [Vagococcus fluvialis]MBO0479623.1 hypothetical protein [Vagococcus fluvialis]MBO0485377.1 hypothetical protein [Vagococcus fluvialis]